MKKDRRNEYTAVAKKILDYLNTLPNGKAINIHGSPYTERGTPDIIGCVNGRMVAFECKRSDTEELERIQLYRLKQWFDAGACVGGVSEVWHVDTILKLEGIL